VSRAFEQYLRTLHMCERAPSAGRLLEDMQILAGAIHYVFAAKGLTTIELRLHLVRLLRETLGFRTSPMSQALSALKVADEAAWDAVPIVPFVGLLAYNTCLADLEVTAEEGVELANMFRNGPVFWMRNVVRALPLPVLERVTTNLARDAERARHGVFWIGSRWQTTTEKLTLFDFTRRLVTDALAVDAAERALADRLAAASNRYDEGTVVLALGRDRSLSVGTIEIETGKLTRPQACIYDSAFLDGVGKPGSSRARMHMLPDASRGVIDLEQARVWASAVSVDALRGVDVLAALP